MGPHAKPGVQDVREYPRAGRAADPDSDVICPVANGDMFDTLLRWVQRQGMAADRGAGGEGYLGCFHRPDVTSTSSTGRSVILFLAANPGRTTRLALEEECAAIERELRMTAGHHDLDLHSRWAITIDEMMHHLNVMQPAVVHFSGHGGSAATAVRDARSQRADGRRDAEAIEDAGIVLQDQDGEPKHVTANALTRMIGSAAPSTRLAVLNACYSQEAARSLCSVVDCAIGMHGSLGDPAARAFAVALYRALGYRRSVENALAQAGATLEAHGLAAGCVPVCHTRRGVSAARVVLPRR